MGLNLTSENRISTTYHSVEWVGAEAVLSSGSLLDEPENENNEPDNRDERDQEPPTRFIQVVQASDTNSY